MADKTPVARVSAIQGKAFVKAADGTMHPLRVGDVIYEGDVVVTNGASRVDLATPDGLSHVMRGNETLTVDAEAVAAIKPDATDAALVSGAKDVNRVIQAINQGGDLDALLEEPAAGESGGSANGGPSFVRLLRIAESVDPLAFNFGTPSAEPVDTGTIGAAAADTATPSTTPTTPATPATVPGAPTVSIPDGGDGVLNAAEVAAGVKANIGLPSNATAGDSLKVDTNGDGIPDMTHTLTADDIAAGKVTVTIPPGDIPANGTLTVSATITNTSGSSSPTNSGNSTTDTIAPVPDVVANTDGSVTINPPTSNVSTEAVTYTPTGSGTPVTAILTKDPTTGLWSSNDPRVTVNPTTGVATIAAAAVADGSTVTALATDPAGNTGNDADTVAKPPAQDPPTVTITLDTNNDGYISSGEKGTATTTNVTVKIPTDAKPGDVITVKDGAGNILATYTVDGTTHAAGSTQTIGGVALPAEGATLTVTATLTPSNGNPPVTGTDSATTDSTAPGAPTVTILDGNDGKLSAAEIAAGVKADIALPSGAVAGDTLKVDTNGDGTIDVTHVLTAADIAAGKVTVGIPAAQVPANGTLTVTATVTDAAGNAGPQGSDASTTDTTAAATITVDKITADNVLNAAESGQTIAVTGTVGGDAKVGDTVTLTINGKAFTGTVLAGNTYSIEVPGSDLAADADHTVEAKVTGADDHGNPFTASGSQAYTTDTTAAATITVDKITADNVL
ncbi:MAG TPA: retention module-containing protein, partial [Accumulibacter sp.]|nr:retention module-containing protein [Accumulibacter sp.]HQC80219.1 retention module-containing protein [Accumulibacter sp.]